MRKIKSTDIYASILLGMIAGLPIILFLTYITYSEKIVVPAMLLVMGFCLFKIRKDL